MENRQNGAKNDKNSGFFGLAFVMILIIAVSCIAGIRGNKGGSEKENTAGSSTGNSTFNSSSYTYRYGSGSGIQYGSGTGSYSYSSGTLKKRTTNSYSTGASKKTTGQKSYYEKTHGRNKMSSKQKAYDDFMEDALENYLSGVDSDEEYWDAVENFGEDWLLPDEKAELDRLMDPCSK